MNAVIRIMRALGDETRARIMRLVLQKELCVCQVIETMRLAPSTVSKHLAILRNAGLVESRKCGRWIHYRTAQVRGGTAVAGVIALLVEGLDDDPKSGADRKRLASIIKCDREMLCRRQADMMKNKKRKRNNGR